MRTLTPSLRTHRARIAVALLSCAGLWLWASAAFASDTSLIWVGGTGGTTGLGTSTAGVSSAAIATITLDVQVNVDSTGFGSGELDFEFDVGPGFDNELNVVGWSELSWANAKGNRSLSPISQGIVSTQESTGSQEGQLFSFETFTLGTGPTSTTLTFARMIFATNPPNAVSDGADIMNTNERDPGLGMFANDGFTDFSGGAGAITAAVNVPEPGAVAMLVVGMATLLLGSVGRRR